MKIRYQYGDENFPDFLDSGKLRTKKIGSLNDPFEFTPQWKGKDPKIMKKIIGKQFCSFSFTSSPKNFLMWSYYGGEHSGICVGFDFDEQPFSWFAKEHDICVVDYERNERIKFDEDILKKEDKELSNWIKKIGSVKGKHWSHEEEERIIMPTDIEHLTEIDETYVHLDLNNYWKSVKEVWVGIECSTDLKFKIETLCSKRNIDFFQLEPCDNTFGFK